MDDFVRSPEVVKHPGFSILARNDVLVQSAMERQGLTLDSLPGVVGQQIASRQSFVGSLASAVSSIGGVRNFFMFDQKQKKDKNFNLEFQKSLISNHF